MTSDLVQEVAAAEQEATSFGSSVTDELKWLQAKDRSRLAKLIVWMFCLVCGATVIFLWTSAYFTAQRWDTAAAHLLDLLSSIVLPVVTLVIGYYFGSEQK